MEKAKRSLFSALRAAADKDGALQATVLAAAFLAALPAYRGFSPLAAAALCAAWLGGASPLFACAGAMLGTAAAGSWASFSACSLYAGAAMLYCLISNRGEAGVTPGLKVIMAMAAQALLLAFMGPLSPRVAIAGAVFAAASAPAAAVGARGGAALRAYLKGKRLSLADALSLAGLGALGVAALALSNPLLSAPACALLGASLAGLCRANSGSARVLASVRSKLRATSDVARGMSCMLAAAEDKSGAYELARSHLAGMGEALGTLALRTPVRKTRFALEMGAAGFPKEGSSETGDSMAMRRVGDSVLLVLSDGMGTGPAAHRESASAVAIYGDLLSIGFDPAEAEICLNRMLMLTGRDTYATLDAVTVDLMTGRARFIKFGAPPAFILRGGKVYTVYCEALPAGILPEARPGVHEATLASGDAVVLMTDGLFEALGSELLASVSEKVSAAPTGDAAAAALLMAGGEGRLLDDMSVIVARIK